MSAVSLRLIALQLPCLYLSDCSVLAVRPGADWCGLMPDWVGGWVRALGFPLFSLSPDPPDLLELLIKNRGKVQCRWFLGFCILTKKSANPPTTADAVRVTTAVAFI